MGTGLRLQSAVNGVSPKPVEELLGVYRRGHEISRAEAIGYHAELVGCHWDAAPCRVEPICSLLPGLEAELRHVSGRAESDDETGVLGASGR